MTEQHDPIVDERQHAQAPSEGPDGHTDEPQPGPDGERQHPTEPVEGGEGASSEGE